MPPSIADRIEFWNGLHDRLAKLSNRVDAGTNGKILTAVHAKIPMPTIDEQRALQLENAKADAEFWDRIHGMNAGTVEDHKGLIATAEKAMASGKAEMDKAAANAHSAKDRVARIQRGENVEGGYGKPADFHSVLREAGFTAADIRRCQAVAEISRRGGFELLLREIMQRKERAETKAIRDMLNLIE
jgi:hypothetical protein